MRYTPGPAERVFTVWEMTSIPRAREEASLPAAASPSPASAPALPSAASPDGSSGSKAAPASAKPAKRCPGSSSGSIAERFPPAEGSCRRRFVGALVMAQKRPGTRAQVNAGEGPGEGQGRARGKSPANPLFPSFRTKRSEDPELFTAQRLPPPRHNRGRSPRRSHSGERSRISAPAPSGMTAMGALQKTKHAPRLVFPEFAVGECKPAPHRDAGGSPAGGNRCPPRT